MSVFPHDECTTCSGKPKFTILLTVDRREGDDAVFHIPNQSVREMQGTGFDHTKQIPFCQDCIRVIEDSLRSTIARLAEGQGKPHPKASKFDF